MIKYLMKCEIFFEVNRERLIYNLESQQAAALGHISYRSRPNTLLLDIKTESYQEMAAVV